MKTGQLRDGRDEMARQTAHPSRRLPPQPKPDSNEPRSRSLTANELAMITVGLDQLRDQPAADELRAQLQQSVAVVLVEKAPL